MKGKPIAPGYFWYRETPEGKWQIVEVYDALAGLCAGGMMNLGRTLLTEMPETAEWIAIPKTPLQ